MYIFRISGENFWIYYRFKQCLVILTLILCVALIIVYNQWQIFWLWANRPTHNIADEKKGLAEELAQPFDFDCSVHTNCVFILSIPFHFSPSTDDDDLDNDQEYILGCFLPRTTDQPTYIQA